MKEEPLVTMAQLFSHQMLRLHVNLRRNK